MTKIKDVLKDLTNMCENDKAVHSHATLQKDFRVGSATLKPELRNETQLKDKKT